MKKRAMYRLRRSLAQIDGASFTTAINHIFSPASKRCMCVGHKRCDKSSYKRIVMSSKSAR